MSSTHVSAPTWAVKGNQVQQVMKGSTPNAIVFHQGLEQDMVTIQKRKFVTCYNIINFCIRVWTVLLFPTHIFYFFFHSIFQVYLLFCSDLICSFWGRSEPGNCISYQAVVQILAKGQVSHRLWKSVNHCPRSKQLSLFSRTLVFTCICFPRKKLY